MAARPKDALAVYAAPLLAVPVAFVLVSASAAVASLRGPARSGREAVEAVEAVGAVGAAEESVDPGPEAHAEARARAWAGRAIEVEPPTEAGDRARRTPAPIRWRRMRSMRCFREDGQRFCDGPLRVPVPHGPAAERAAALGLDDERRVGPRALHQPPEEAWLEAVEGERRAGLLWPVPEGRMARGYGQVPELVPAGRGRLVREGERMRLHPGVDIAARAGSAIRAVDDGLVLYSANRMRGYGNSVILLHADGTVTLYAHCRATLVFAGQRVRRGQPIAEVGRTGLAHGEHLHFEWRRDGRALDPAPRFVEVPAR
jgi:murein DD-endopeptidase MepM/ murein hydrolase activator NlpD